MAFYKILFLMALSTYIQAKPIMIAHAGGGINGQNYSNSIEALTHNYANGFRLFEIDFSWTSDDQLVCLHDWDKRFKKVFGYKVKHRLSYKLFKQQISTTTGLHPCTLDSLATWLDQHQDTQIITDVKYHNIKAIKKIVKTYPALQKQLIPQFYQPEEYQTLKALGFEKLIWILYQYKGTLKSVAQLSKNMDLLALSMRASQAKKKPMQQAKQNGTNLFVYTINKEKKVEKLTKAYHVTGIYTDFLQP